jgi:hypothetical protein
MMKQAILTNWSFSRALRLVLGIVILVQALYIKDGSLGLTGLLFTLMPVFNIGCCGVGGCYVPSKQIEKNPKDVIYEEVI